jgi:hypothetical protein
MHAILKDKDKYLELAKSGVNMNNKSSKREQNSLLEQILYDWYIDQKKANVNVTGPMIQAKAEELSHSGTDTCKFSAGWLERFKQRYNITFGRKIVNYKEESQKNSLLEQILYQWVVQQQQCNIIVSGPALKAKAEELSKVCATSSTGFKFTTNWLDAFKKRHNIKFRIPENTTGDEEPDIKPLPFLQHFSYK